MWVALERLGKDWHGRDLFLLELPSWKDWPHDLELPSEHFCLLVAGDTSEVESSEIAAFATAALASGCVYACSWGPGCKLVHDTFDAKSETESNGSVVMTTWHDDEGLDDALTYLVRDALPDDPWIASCRTSLVVVVGNKDCGAEVRRLAPGSKGLTNKGEEPLWIGPIGPIPIVDDGDQRLNTGLGACWAAPS